MGNQTALLIENILMHAIYPALPDMVPSVAMKLIIATSVCTYLEGAIQKSSFRKHSINGAG